MPAEDGGLFYAAAGLNALVGTANCDKLKSAFCKIIISPMVNDSGFCRRDFNVGIVQLSNSQTSYRFRFRRFISALKCDSNIVFFF